MRDCEVDEIVYGPPVYDPLCGPACVYVSVSVSVDEQVLHEQLLVDEQLDELPLVHEQHEQLPLDELSLVVELPLAVP